MGVDKSASDFFVAGGTLRPDAPSYVERSADNELFNLTLAGRFCYVLTPRQMGKSSLMIRTARRLREQGVSTAIVDLTSIGTGVSVEQWYLSLLTQLKRRLRLAVDPAAWWQERAGLTHAQRLTDFLRDVVLAEIEGRVVVFIDEIDSTLSLGFRDDFFAAIRATYNARADDPAFERLTFVLLGVASPPDLISDQARTPFNIGQGIALGEFSRADAAVLQAGLEAAYPGQGEAIFARIYHWTNGHPYLTQKLCLTVAEAENGRWSDERVDELVESLFLSEEARSESNLKFVQNNILNHPRRDELLKLYRRVLKKGETGVGDDGQSPTHNRLKLSGIVEAEDGRLRVRNEIYRRVFDLAWVRRNTVTNWTRVVAGVAIFVALLAISFILRDVWVGFQFRDCENAFLKADASEERLASLTRAFRLRTLLLPADYDHEAKGLFYGLSRGDQLDLFDSIDVHDVEELDVVKVVRGLYTTLADVDGTGGTTPLLEKMESVLGRLGEAEETEHLRNEIGSWLEGRDLARQNRYDDARAAYDAAIEENADNPATRYERAAVLIELSEYHMALTDLDQVVAIEAGRTLVPTSSPPVADPSVGLTPAMPTPYLVSTPLIQIPISTISVDSITTTPISTTLTPPTEETPVSLPAPVFDSPGSEFTAYGQVIDAVSDLIYSDRYLVNFLARTSSSEYPNLRDSGLVPSEAPYEINDCRYFAETGHYVCDEFLEFFETRGGFDLFGHPLTEAFNNPAIGMQVQYFQNARMELHIHNPDPYKVQLGLLVEELGYKFPPVGLNQIPDLNSSLHHYFPETDHVVSYAFLDYFNEKGGLDIFGYPRSEFMYEGGFIVQYFQRVRMEWHPESISGEQMRLTNLGEIYLERLGVPEEYRVSLPLPQPSSVTPAANRSITKLNVSASVRYVIVGRDGIQTVFVYVIDQEQRPVQGASVEIVVHYQSSDQLHEFEPTNASGFTRGSFEILPSTSGKRVVIEVTVTYGRLRCTIDTLFVPWW